jgi:hypothetical protein
MNYKDLVLAAIKNLDPPTAYRLSKALNLRQPSPVYGWLNHGKAPSSANLLKILELGQSRKETSNTHYTQ